MKCILLLVRDWRCRLGAGVCIFVRTPGECNRPGRDAYELACVLYEMACVLYEVAYELDCGRGPEAKWSAPHSNVDSETKESKLLAVILGVWHFQDFAFL